MDDDGSGARKVSDEGTILMETNCWSRAQLSILTRKTASTTLNVHRNPKVMTFLTYYESQQPREQKFSLKAMRNQAVEPTQCPMGLPANRVGNKPRELLHVLLRRIERAHPP